MTDSAVIDGRERSDWFEIKTGVKPGCNISGFRFLAATRVDEKDS
jgi:hypothetical protein